MDGEVKKVHDLNLITNLEVNIAINKVQPDLNRSRVSAEIEPITSVQNDIKIILTLGNQIKTEQKIRWGQYSKGRKVLKLNVNQTAQCWSLRYGALKATAYCKD